MTTNLDPCPFCGGIDLDGESNGDGGEWVYCNACWADGPMARTNDGETAEHLWNTRSSDKNAKLVEALRQADSALCADDIVAALRIIRAAGAEATGIVAATEPCAKIQQDTHG